MNTTNEILTELRDDDVWYFAKQDTSFDNAFNAVKIFSQAPQGENPSSYYQRISKERHLDSNVRILSVAQLMGLLSKTTPFVKLSYDKESPTQAFYELQKYSLGSMEYNAIKTEQLLKIRMKAITDTRNTEGFGIYPFLYVAEILWRLSIKGVTKIPRDAFFQYVMTSKDHNDIDSRVDVLSKSVENIPVNKEQVKKYMENSRVETIIKNNIRLFNIDDKYVRINDDFVKYYSCFFNGPYKSIITLLYSIVDDVEMYQDILTKVIGISLNFINAPQSKPDGSQYISTIPDKTFSETSLYRPYITAIKSKPFLLLAGISGTGKSRIVRELARTCWDEEDEERRVQKPRNFEMIQVKPNWHDSTELIGYVTRVSGNAEFVAGDFLKFVARAWEETDVPYFLCLDEMNLAPVEQYFAEYLSVVETRKKNDEGVIVTDPILRKANAEWYYNLTAGLTIDDDLRQKFNTDGISLPPNLIVVGTVNMDETTFSFSRKVLDRAMTIEMNEVDLYGGLTNRHEHIGMLGCNELICDAVEGVDVYADNKEVCDVALKYLQSVNQVLDGTPFKIAYRTRNEFLLYVVNNLPYNKDKDGNELPRGYVIARALDEITNMKILPRIEGDDTKVTDSLLDELKATIGKGLKEVREDDSEEQSISIRKLDEMKRRLQSGYTSYWS